MNDYDKNKESSCLKYWEVNNSYGCTMSKKFPVNNVEWVKDTCKFNEGFIKSYNEKTDEAYFLVVDVKYT